jgi:heme A synthase
MGFAGSVSLGLGIARFLHHAPLWQGLALTFAGVALLAPELLAIWQLGRRNRELSRELKARAIDRRQ